MSLRTLSLALAGLALTACAKKAAELTPPETAADVAAAPEDIDALEAQLAAREDQLRALGAGPPPMAGGGESALAKREELDADAQSAGDVTTKKKSAEQQVAAEAPQPSAAPAPATERAGPSPVAGRCESVCDITTSICQLRDHICDLAPRHADEPRYQQACERASTDCEFATEACHACA
ncbi:hypothetical protein [Nannocystis punicea]|uniref:Uncharacterized protein n=1 Tax=Nannocystis punicea TaxID=2995304 RepID=A0ABY7H3X5_9BACT|nr:hypothetical protein [Nannocystis poenicansa]WAS93800.1 hypothetical protein O0S08_47310 [Nannocystis poenicansa]